MAVRPIGGVEVQLYSFMTTPLEGGEGSASRTGSFLHPGKTRYPLCWVDPRAGLDRGGKSRPHRDSIPVPSSPWPVAIPTTLPRLKHVEDTIINTVTL